MAVTHCCAGTRMAPDDGERPRDRQAPETLVLQRRQRGEPLRCPGTPPEKAVIGGDGWPRRRASRSSPAGTGAETPPARVRRFRRGAAPTPRLECAQDALGAVWNANDRSTYNPSRARAGSSHGSACGPCYCSAWPALQSGCISGPATPGMRASTPNLCQLNQPVVTWLPSPNR